uniref:Protein farnesyltransferase/geranylgeranyltransferase type-1 subunit alpha n=1 Tax=Arcella intermedia TaxID=1963864 RepID=A0A6B2LBA1_9EUKA
MNYLRAFLRKDERSERALEVTKEAIALNPANYTAWHYRRVILDALKADYQAELAYVTQMAMDNPKNYQIWHHRQVVVERLGDASKELEFVGEILEEDAKNYHAWSHRQWVIRKWGLWENELAYCEKLLSLDIRNNSAWNQRYFVAAHEGLSKEVISREIDFAISKISRTPNNESAWNYLLGVIKNHKLSEFPIIQTFCQEKATLWVACPHVLSTLVECYEESQETDKLKQAVEHCEKLITNLDQMHHKYWVWRKAELLKQIKE